MTALDHALMETPLTRWLVFLSVTGFLASFLVVLALLTIFGPQ